MWIREVRSEEEGGRENLKSLSKGLYGRVRAEFWGDWWQTVEESWRIRFFLPFLLPNLHIYLEEFWCPRSGGFDNMRESWAWLWHTYSWRSCLYRQHAFVDDTEHLWKPSCEMKVSEVGRLVCYQHGAFSWVWGIIEAILVGVSHLYSIDSPYFHTWKYAATRHYYCDQVTLPDGTQQSPTLCHTHQYFPLPWTFFIYAMALEVMQPLQNLWNATWKCKSVFIPQYKPLACMRWSQRINLILLLSLGFPWELVIYMDS